MKPIYIIGKDRVGGIPGLDAATAPCPVVAWLDVCHTPHIGIHYDEHRETSRWQLVDRARRYRVEIWRPKRSQATTLGYYKDVQRAYRAALQYCEL